MWFLRAATAGQNQKFPSGVVTIMYDDFDDSGNIGNSIVNGVGGSTHSPTVVNGAGGTNWTVFAGDLGPTIQSGGFCRGITTGNNQAEWELASAERTAGFVVMVTANLNTSASGSDFMYVTLCVSDGGLVTDAGAAGAVEVLLLASSNIIQVAEGTGPGSAVRSSQSHTFPGSGNETIYIAYDYQNKTVSVYDSSKTVVPGLDAVALTNQPTNNYITFETDAAPDTDIYEFGIKGTTDVSQAVFP